MLKIPKLKAVWLGDGRGAAALDTKISGSSFASHHARLKWTPDVRPFYAAIDILAMPSVESETFGRVSIEAQASGVPVLCSDIGGIPETLLPGVTGLLLTPGNIALWREAIIELANNTEKRLQMGKQGRDWVERRFSAPVIGHEFAALLENNR